MRKVLKNTSQVHDIEYQVDGLLVHRIGANNISLVLYFLRELGSWGRG